MHAPSLAGELKVQLEAGQNAVLRFTESDEELKLDLVMVPRRFQGRGIGSRLVERLLFLADALHLPVVTTARPIGVSQPSATAEAVERLVAYYARFGFVVVQRGLTVAHLRRESRGGTDV